MQPGRAHVRDVLEWKRAVTVVRVGARGKVHGQFRGAAEQFVDGRSALHARILARGGVGYVDSQP
jgi:hypothetical protein